MTPEASAALVERFWDEVWGARNPDAIVHVVTDDFVITTAGVDVVGPDAFTAWVANFQATISDLRWETIETFANVDGSRVASRFRVTGRNNGMFGLPADDRPVDFTGNAIVAITPDGKLARSSVERSAWELYGRLTGSSWGGPTGRRSGGPRDPDHP